MLFRCVAAIPNGGGGCIEHFYEDTPEGRVSAEAFARQYDKPGMGVYDCVSPLRDRRRTKDNVAQIDGLHVDIDAYKLKKTKDEVVTALRDEFSALGILSRLNSSGRGIHAHFFFREPIEAGTPEAAQAQQILKRLVAHLGADPQPAHFAALMRRVGTTNSKEGGGPCETLLDTGAKCELADIEGYLELVEGREELFPRPEPKTNCGDAQHKGPVDVEVELASMVPGDESGRGVNATQVRVITSLIWRALHPAEICKKVVDATMEMAERRGLTWNRHEEETDVAKRTLCQYRTAFENEYDPATGIIPVWLPMEFHAQWAAILANGGHPTMDKRRFWYVGRTDKKTNGEKTNGGAEDNNSLMHEEATPGDGPTAPFILRPLEPFDPAALPCREFLLGKHYQRRVVSGTVAPGGTGKSSKVMSEGISMATARDLLDEQPRERLRVWLHNGEGNMDELRRRLAGNCQHHGIPLEELRGWFFMTSGNEVPLRVAQSFNQVRMQTDNRLIKCIAEQIGDNKIDVAIFDPLVTLHGVPENDSGKMDAVVRIFANIADAQNCAIDLSHHCRKPPPGAASNDYDIDDMRGAKAISDAMRAVRILNFMSSKEAEAAGLLDIERQSYFRVDRGKANYSGSSKVATWRRFFNVDLPNGDAVGIVLPWQFPGQEGAPPSPEKLETERKAEHVFLEILRRLTLAGRFVGERGPYNAPHVFAKEREAKIAKVGKAALSAAMVRLFDKGKIRIEDYVMANRHPGVRIVEA